MKTVLIVGTFFNTTSQKLLEIFEGLLVKEKLRFKVRISGEEINYEDDLLEIYIYSLGHQQNVNLNQGFDNYQFETEYKGSLNESEKFLNKLISIFLKEDIKYQFEYSEAIDGEEVGEEFELEHPGLQPDK